MCYNKQNISISLYINLLLKFYPKEFFFTFFLMKSNKKWLKIIDQNFAHNDPLAYFYKQGHFFFLLWDPLRYDFFFKGQLLPPSVYCWEQNMRLRYDRKVHLVLHPHGIAPTFLKLDSLSLGAGFISIISTKGINLIKKEKIYE